MKRIIIGLLLILVLSGCSASINYEFEKEKIKSTINADFTIDDYYDNLETEIGDKDMNNQEKEELLFNDKSSIVLNAFSNNNIQYSEVKFDKNNYKYNVLYKYDYDYTNIKDSYFFNCFENYKYFEDEDYYNFELSGSYKCNTSIKLKVSSEFGIDKSNSIEVKDGVHTFDLYEENNKIVFSVRKHRFNNVNTTKTIRIVAFVIMMIMIFITFMAYRILKRNSY